MRAPKRKRPQLRRIIPPAAGVDRQALAELADYVGSPEHKRSPSFAGAPRPRADATICDPLLNDRLEDIRRWLREAIRRGCCSALWDGRFPRYLWYLEAGIACEARLVNRELGHYKGYPLQPDEWPAGIEEFYEQLDH